MLKFLELSTLRPVPAPTTPCCVALGNFDGVHLGHQALLRQTADSAAKQGLLAAAFLFDPPPFPERTPQLTTPEEKLRLLARCGIRCAALTDFESLRDLSPEAFVQQILRAALHCQTAVCGFHYHFGAYGAGDAALLAALLRSEGAAAEIIPPVLQHGKLVSSTAIRQAIAAGDMPQAASLLGRSYSLGGEVLHGRAMGRTLGFPTANLAFPPHSVLPRFGVYATLTDLGDGLLRPGVTNVGIRPTVDHTEHPTVTAETYLSGFAGDLYGHRIRVFFHCQLRAEQTFPTLSALEEAIRKDSEKAEQILSAPHIPTRTDDLFF